MNISEEDSLTLERVLGMLGSGRALAQDLEEYVVGYHILGNLVAMAESDHEQSELSQKIAWATEFAAAKTGDGKPGDQLAKAMADIATADSRRAVIAKREQYMKLRATRDAVQEAIWAQKYLGRNGG